MFTVEEARLLAMYPSRTPREAERQLRATLPHITDVEMLVTIGRLLDKLRLLTQADFEEYIDAMDIPDAQEEGKGAKPER